MSGLIIAPLAVLAFMAVCPAVSYAATPDTVWTRQLGTPNNGSNLGFSGNDVAKSIVLDASGSVYVGGYTYGDLDGNVNAGEYDAFVVKYDATGVKQWTKLIQTPYDDEATGVAVDASGNVYVAGFTSGWLDGTSGSNGVTYYYRVKATKTGATASAWKTAANGCRVN